MFDSQTETFDVVTRGKKPPSLHLAIFSLAIINAACGVMLLAVTSQNTGNVRLFLTISVLITIAAGTHLVLLRRERRGRLRKAMLTVVADDSKTEFSDRNRRGAPQDSVVPDDRVRLGERQDDQLCLTKNPLSILALVDGCVSVFERSKMSDNVDIKIEISPDVPRHVLGDEAHLNQMIDRLLESSTRHGFSGLARLTVDRDWEGQGQNLVRFAIKAIDMKVSPDVLLTGAARGDGPTFRVGEADYAMADSCHIAGRMRGDMWCGGDPLEAMLSFRVVLPPASEGRSIVKDQKSRRIEARGSVQSYERLSAC